MKNLSMAAALAAVALCCSQPAGAQPAPAGAPAAAPAPAAVPARSLIQVSDCNPKLNVQQFGGGYAGFAPGPWGGGYWGDVYGASFYQPPVTTANPQLAIHYRNISPKTMSKIEFGLVANGVLLAEVLDVGTFSPNAEIKHRFAISANVFPIRTGLPQCVPLRITFEDGTKWRNPGLPPKNTHIYYNP
jgi:hypothetical protein